MQGSSPLSGTPRSPALADAAPWTGFAEAADAVLALLQEQLGMDLWAVTRVREGRQEIVVARSRGFPLPPGAVLPWAESLCVHMVAGTAPRVAPRVRAEPAYADLAFTARHRVGAYVGVPLVDEDGALFGTLCALSTQEQPARLAGQLPLVEVLARQLSTLLAKERLAAERSAAAAEAYAVAERDPLTGLLNRRGWERALRAEEDRCRRSGRSSGVAVVDLDHLAEVNRREGHEAGDARVLRTASLVQGLVRAADVVARVDGDEFAVLGAEARTGDVEALSARLRASLRQAGLGASLAVAARDTAGTLDEAWRRAQEEVVAAQRATRPR
jgi:diguanylate cyclase (GGDEF)-like protein